MTTASAQFHRPRSHWHNHAQAYQPHPPLVGDRRADVCIIGAGLSGISTAYNLLKKSPGLEIVVLEQEVTGFGASGRNAGQLLVGLGGADMGSQIQKYGIERTRFALEHQIKGLNDIRDLQKSEGVVCDYQTTGYMKTALRVEGMAGLDKYLSHLETLGQGSHFTRLSQAEVEAELQSPLLGGAIYDPRGGQLNPLKLVRGLKDVAVRRGLTVHESSPVAAILPGQSSIRVETGQGEVICQKVVLATNAYTHLLPGVEFLGLLRQQRPLIVRAIITEPLSEAVWENAGWPRRCGVNIYSQLFYSFAPTPDGRLLWVGGYHTYAPRGELLGPEVDAQLKSSPILGQFFPRLSHLRTSQVWGGPVSITADWLPHVGYSQDPRILFSCGCWGHGMALAMANGGLIADMLLDPDGDAGRVWFVNRRKKQWPPKLISDIAAAQVIRNRRRGNRKTAAKMVPPLKLE